MFSPAPRGRQILGGMKVLLIDPNQSTRELRASVMRSRGMEIHTADSLRAARFLWQPSLYRFILLDVRRHFPGEALEFYQQIKTASAKEHFIFLVGPPAFLSLTWADDVTAEQKEPQQWAETINRFLAAA